MLIILQDILADSYLFTYAIKMDFVLSRAGMRGMTFLERVTLATCSMLSPLNSALNTSIPAPLLSNETRHLNEHGLDQSP